MSPPRADRARPLVALARAAIRAYQLVISPLLGPRCKYHPTCSAYALEAIESFGILRGSVLAAWRVLRCNPWSLGGLDPVAAQRLFPAARAARPATPTERRDP
jgi:putative membrane protein insertion efficiency factor